MSNIFLFLTRENLLSYCKDTQEELAKAREKLKQLEKLRDKHVKENPLPENFWSILIRIRNTKEKIDDIKHSLAFYQEQLDILSIG